MTWQECKQAALEKMFSASGQGQSDEAARDYLAAMPAAASEAVQRISAVRPLRRWAEFGAGPGPSRQDLAALAWDYKNAGNLEVYFEGPEGLAPLRGVRVLGGRWLCLPDLPAAGRVWLAYEGRPFRLSADTPDGWRLPLEEDAAALLPLYMAGQLYKEDDLRMATYYMNEFEAGMYALAPADKGVLADAFTSESGW